MCQRNVPLGSGFPAGQERNHLKNPPAKGTGEQEKPVPTSRAPAWGHPRRRSRAPVPGPGLKGISDSWPRSQGSPCLIAVDPPAKRFFNFWGV